MYTKANKNKKIKDKVLELKAEIESKKEAKLLSEATKLIDIEEREEFREEIKEKKRKKT